MATVAATAAAAYTIAINFSSTASPLRFSYGADGNSGPECGTHVSVAAELHSFGATLIRTHDADAIDWPLVFPHPKFDVPTDDPDSYDWTRADAYFHKLVDNGFEPYVRLGTSWGQQGGGGLPPAGVPYNRTALVDVLLHTVMHLNDGWGGGFTGKAVRHFEIWNEPDSSCAFHNISGCGRFWNRTAADFYALVDEAARVIKTYDPTLSVGTCGAANLAWPAHNPYGLALIAELGGRGTPLDFFSWHGYIDQPSWYAARAAEVRSALDAAFPGRNVAQHVTEFFPCVLYKEQDTAYGAAAFASTLTTFVHSGVRLATLYPLCAGGEGRTGGKGWGLFDQESVPGVATWRRLTHAFAAFGELAQSTPQLLTPAIVPAVPSPSNLTVLVGRDESGRALKALLSTETLTSNTTGPIEVVLSGLDARAPWAWSVVAVNESVKSLEFLAGGVRRPDGKGVLRLAFPLKPPAVALLRVVKS